MCFISIDYIPNFYSNDGPDNVEVSRVVETLVNEPGFGTRCMIGDPIPWVFLSAQEDKTALFALYFKPDGLCEM